jgi:hypothetical protein
LHDSVRGYGNYLISNSTAAQGSGGGVTASTSTGFNYSIGNTNNWISWNWKAGGTAVSNTDGTITSSVSANQTSGFSVVTYTGTGSNATVGHGLGVAPQFILTKTVSTALGNWGVYHASLGATKALNLNNTIAAATFIQFWNNTAPTSTVFSVGTSNDVNGASTYVAYCWAEIAGFSKFGSYTGNGSTDGPFVYTGFRPRYILIKNSTTAGTNWLVLDSATNTYNAGNLYLIPNASSAEQTSGADIDILSNGFKIRNTSGSGNTSSATIIYSAFAENPFKYANAR